MSQPRLLIATHNPGKMREYRKLLRDVPYRLVSLDDLGITQQVKETGRSFEENAGLKARAFAALSGLLTLADDSGLEVDALGGEPGIHSARYGEESPRTPLRKKGDEADPIRGAGGNDMAGSTEVAEGLTDRDRVALLLRNLEGVPWERRTARFRCVIAVATPRSCPSSEGIPPSPLYQRGVRGDLAPRPKPGPSTEGPPDVTLVAGTVDGMIQYEPLGEGGFGYDPVFYLPSHGLTMAQITLEEKNRISHRAGAARKAAAVLKRVSGG